MNQPLQRADTHANVIGMPHERDRLSLWLTVIVIALLSLVLYVFWTNFGGSLGAATTLLKQLLAFCLGLGIPAGASISAHRACRRIMQARDGHPGSVDAATGR